MSVSLAFIRRPVATTLLTVGVMLLGLLSLSSLPIAPLPHVDIPTIKVHATLPGASPETIAQVLTTPLERALGKIPGVKEIYSSSTASRSKIVLQFELDKDINKAAREVQAALNAAQGQLPAGMASNPVFNKVNPSKAPILILALTSETLNSGQLYDLGQNIIVQKLSQISGVGDVEIEGSSAPAIRVDLNPKPLHKYGISLVQVQQAIAGYISHSPRGTIDGESKRWHININGQLTRLQDFKSLIIGRNERGDKIRLGDVAHIHHSVENIHMAGVYNGKPAVLILIRAEPGANITDTVERIYQRMPALVSALPAAVNVHIAMERTSTIRASLVDAGYTLIIAVCLVTVIVLLFLGNLRAALIPMVSVPVSILATFIVMKLLGYTLDNLSLMALTIVVGFVVDDTVVVLENIARHIEQGLSPRKAAQIGVKEVTSTVVAMTLVLIAVFIPFLFMKGYVGLFVREFSVTLTVAVLISLIIALTTAPMLCAQLLKLTPSPRRHGYLYRFSDGVFRQLQHIYAWTLRLALKHSFLTLLILFVTIGLNIYLYIIIPKGFFPQQDTGQISGNIYTDQYSSFQLTKQKMLELTDRLADDPDIANIIAFTGHTQRNIASLYIMLKPHTQRKSNAYDIIQRLYAKVAGIAGASLSLKPMQDIKTGGRRSRASYEYTLQADDLDLLNAWTTRIRRALAKIPLLTDIGETQNNQALETYLVVNYEAASRLGVSARDIDLALNNAFSQRIVSTIYESQNQHHVVMGLAPEYMESPTTLKDIYISTAYGRAIPLSLIAHYEQRETLLSVEHYALVPSTSISFNKAKGVSLSQAIEAINQTVHDLAAPSSVRGSYQGSAKAFKDVLTQLPFLVLAAFLTLYIILGMLYESLIHPFTIMSTLPSAGVGALIALMLFRHDFNVIAMIGIFMLIGIVMKNAIMMIDFALEERRNHRVSSEDAIFSAAQRRFRPILMTTLAALLASIPLALGQGDGAEMRQPLGIAIGGGLILSQLLTLYSTPVVYLYFDRLANWLKQWRQRRNVRIQPE